jgi:hypothetical protein
VDCVVSAWGAWGSCSKSCGQGSHSRSRSTVRVTAHGGVGCGVFTQVQNCNVHPCPVDCVEGAFGAWSTCTTSCGAGSQKRSRTHVEPTFGRRAHRCPDRRADRRADRCADRCTDRRAHGRADHRAHGRAHGRAHADGRADGRANGRALPRR